MVMKRIYLLLIALAVTSVGMAKPVPLYKLNRISEHFFPGSCTMTLVGEHGEMMLYKPLAAPGFLLLSTDDCVRPVLAYSYTGNFDLENMPESVRQWLGGYERSIAASVAVGEEATPEVVADWQRWLEGNPKSNDNYVEPLLTTRWSQRPFYNNLCPYDSIDSAFAVTGCVATAMAQIMRYWEWPVVGWGSHSYVHPRYGTLSADFGNTVYRWDRMPDTLSALCDSFKIDAVATLMYQAGVAVEMNYGTGASGAQTISYYGLGSPCAENALKTYFRYNPQIYSHMKSSFSDAEWDAMLRADLDAARPILYSGSDISAGGHAFVLDGYDTLGMFHLNWGWGGNYDAYYTIDSLSPGAGSLGGEPLYTFNYGNAAIFNIYPVQPTIDTVISIDFVTSNLDWGSIEGSGIYHPYDTVSIIPHAAEGFRYQRMSSGLYNIPLTFLAVNDVTDTVFFERMEGDTVGYCDDNVFTAWRDDYSSTTEWGIRIPPVVRQARQLTAVQLYVYMGADYTMNIYVGDSIDGATPVYTGQYHFYNEEVGWNTLPLDSVLTFHRSQTIWVTFSVTDDSGIFPASCAPFCGNSDGSWYHLPGGWQPYDQEGVYYTWMLRAVFDSRDRLYVAVSPNDINAGDITGRGYYAPGDNVTLNALPKNGYQFSYWSNGSTDNPMDFIITRDTSFIAFFEPIIGIDEIEETQMEIEISGLTVTVNNPGNLPVSLYDIQGRLLTTSDFPIFDFQFSTPGVYLLESVGLPARKIVVTR